jgi:hypothetical protein
MNIKHPKTLAGRTLYRVLLCFCVVLLPFLLPLGALLDYLRDDYIGDLKMSFEAVPKAFKKGEAI